MGAHLGGRFTAVSGLSILIASAGLLVLPAGSVEPPALYARANYMWPFATGPHYGEVDPSRVAAAGVLRTDVGSFDMRRGSPPFPDELRASGKLDPSRAQYFLLVMDPASVQNGSLEHLRDAIVSESGAIVREMAVSSFIVRLNRSSLSLVRGHSGVLALEPYHPAFKLSPTIGRAPLQDPVKALADRYDLDIMIFPGEDTAAVARAVSRMGGKVLSTAPDLVRAELHRDRLAEVASIEAVEHVYEHLPVFLLGEETTTLVQTGSYNNGATPFHDVFINGGGARGTCSTSTTIACQGPLDCPGAETCAGAGSPQVLMIIDSGIQLDAGDLSDTRVNAGTAGPAHRKVRAYQTINTFTGGGRGDLLGCDASATGGFTHGHVVASTALGNATATPLDYGGGFQTQDRSQVLRPVDGVAPRALLVAYDALVTPLQGSCADPLNASLSVGDIYTTEGSNTPLEVSYHTHGARTVNFSWGTRNNSNYATNATRIDAFLSNAGHLDSMLFLAAGNDGQDLNPTDSQPDPGSISDPATSKNAIVVGACGNTSEPVGPDEVPPQNVRASFSSVGPGLWWAPLQRIAPLLMAPGTDAGASGGNMGFDSEFACRSNDNTQTNPVECDVSEGISGTSFASSAAAGAGMLVRDFFAQGFYPDGTSANSGNSADQVPAISGALLKAILVASAEFMSKATANSPTNDVGYAEQLLSQKFRFNREQGYGRIQLTNVLPLQSYNPTPVGLIVADGGIPGGKNSTSLSGDIDLSAGETDTTTFTVCDDSRELRVALAWIEPQGDSSTKNLDLELVAPSGKVYLGNFFTDDQNRDGTVSAAENCPATAITGNVVDNKDQSPWSLPTAGCGSPADFYRDDFNPTEGIFLSPDARRNGTVVCLDADKQTEIGTWSLRVKTGVPNNGGIQRYAVAIAGGVCLGSSVHLDSGGYACNEAASIVVNEIDEASDPQAGLTDAEVASRTLVEVIDPGADGLLGTSDDAVTDTEDATSVTPLVFMHTGLKFTSSPMALTDGTSPQARNGILDVRSGQVLLVTYRDKTDGSLDANKRRTSSAGIDCKPSVGAGGVVFSQFGMDTSTVIEGGCERDARGLFTFAFPDRYIDAGERLAFRVAFQSTDADLTDVEVSLRCVLADPDSPVTCIPGTTGCADPDRANNAPCTELAILDSPKTIGDLPAGQIGTASFAIEVAGAIAGTPKVDMLVGVSARKSGRTVEAVLVSRHTLDADEMSLFYSTDYPSGAAEVRDHDNDEVENNPTTNPVDPDQDYRFDTVAWSSLVATGRNTGIQAPWSFETNNGGFTVGLNNTTTSNLVSEIISLWGEDKDFDNVLDYHCSSNANISCTGPGDTAPCGGNVCISDEDRDPQNLVLDNNWSTDGGCGWQTNGTANNPNLPGGIWHTGRVDAPGPPNCLVSGATPGACQNYETLGGTTNVKRWWEILLTPPLQKVNQCRTDMGPLPASCGGLLDAPAEPIFRVEFLNWAWNMALDLKDKTAEIRYELDTDTQTAAPVDLFNDELVLNAVAGPRGPVTGGDASLTDGFQVFAPFSGGTAGGASQNGSVGRNRVGRNPCYFETNPVKLPLHLARPADDDTDNDGDTAIDEFVTPSGPIRNFDITLAGGPDMRRDGLEDLYGEPGSSFQAALGFRLREGDATTGASGTSFGATVDDMVIQWREYRLQKDATGCSTSGACATVQLDTSRVYDGDGLVTISVHDASPYGMSAPGNVNDCNGDGDFTDPGVDDTDCNGNGTSDVTVKVTSESEPAGERGVLDRVGSTSLYSGTLALSATTDVPGVLLTTPRFEQATDTITVNYEDRWDGTASGSRCQNDPDPARQGFVAADATVVLASGRIIVQSFRVADVNGDLDGLPDTNETVDLYVTVANKTGRPLTNLVARLSTSDPKVECILSPLVWIGSVPAGTPVESPTAFRLKIGSSADRGGTNPPATCDGGVCSNGAGACAAAADCPKTVAEDYVANLRVAFSSDEFDGTTRPQEISLDLDLNVVTPAIATTTFIEGFESGFGNFQLQNIDDNKFTNTLSNGYRCQYNDPDFPNSNSYGDTDCYMGFANQSPINDWHPHTTAAVDAGRAFLGNNSMHYGKHTPGNPGLDTYGLGQLDAIRTKSFVSLAARVCQALQTGQVKSCNSAADCTSPASACISASPELSFKHQVSTIDSRFGTLGIPEGEAADRAVVGVQVLGSPTFEKISPYENVYDVQGTDVLSRCGFDPIDDGNNEDSYFDPTDPYRRLGPSSTCFPEFVFSYLGDTDAAFNVTNIGRASDGPGRQGSIGTGTWVESKFDLTRYRGRSIKIRFLFTSIQGWGSSFIESWEMLFMWNPIPQDDGWYVDDVRVNWTLGAASPTVSLDAADNSGLLGCGNACNSLTASLTASPSSTPAPGRPVLLTAQASSADRCTSGALLFQFWIDGNGNGSLGDPQDTLLREFTTNPILEEAPLATTRYGVRVKCSSAPPPPPATSCNGAEAIVDVTVGCPGRGVFAPDAWWSRVTFDADKATLRWPATHQSIDALRGDLATLRTGSFGGATCLQNNASVGTVTDTSAPPAGDGFYYLLRGTSTSFCNDSTSWSTFHTRENPTNPGKRDAEITSCSP